MTMPIMRAEDLTYTKVRALDMNRTVYFQPVSALEVHGPHLPLGMDFYMARWMAEETGRRFAEKRPTWTVVQLPPLPLGTDELPLAGSMNANQNTVYSALRAHARSLARAGCKYVVLTNGHGGPRHAAALEAVCRWANKKHRMQMFTPSIAVLHAIISGKRVDAIEAALGRPLTDNERSNLGLGVEHAAGWETSFMLAQNPELVEPGHQNLAYDGPPEVPWLGALGDSVAGLLSADRAGKTREMFHAAAGGLGWLLNAHYGYGGATVTYHGTPAVASPELGHAFRNVMADDCLALLESVVTGERDAREIRSIASDAAPIQPGFWRRVALVAALVLFLLV
jgi:creatinine amidohydrolase